MQRAPTDGLTVQRSIILGLLLTLAVAAWVLLIWQGEVAGSDMTMASPTVGLRAPLFLAIWVVMMVAMMFPAAAPMILTFHTVQQRKRESRGAFVSTWVFVAAYLVVWTLAGVAAYAGALAADSLAARATVSPAAAARCGGALLIVAGIYQITPLKDVCLSKCRTPLSFIMTSWREGVTGALRMGVLHGAWCLGCCWLLFVILFPLGLMNIGAMAVITLIIFAEKTLPWGQAVARGAAVALIIYGVVVLAVPQALPTFMATSEINMKAPAEHTMMDTQNMPMPALGRTNR